MNRVLGQDEASELEARAGAMRRIVLGPRESSDLRMISIGAFSPLTGFLKSDDYASVVADSRLTTGEVWTIPITLAVGADDAAGLGQGDELALYDMDGSLLGAMTAEDIFSYDPLLEAMEVFRTEDEDHPGVANLYSQGDTLVGGPISALPRRPLEVYADADRPPAVSRALFESNGWRTVVGFQTRNPIHRAHEYIMKCAPGTCGRASRSPAHWRDQGRRYGRRGQDALLPGTAVSLLPNRPHRSVHIPCLHALRRGRARLYSTPSAGRTTVARTSSWAAIMQGSATTTARTTPSTSSASSTRRTWAFSRCFSSTHSTAGGAGTWPPRRPAHTTLTPTSS